MNLEEITNHLLNISKQKLYTSSNEYQYWLIQGKIEAYNNILQFINPKVIPTSKSKTKKK
jgi:hypothetical protein